MTSPEISISEAEVDAAARAYKRWEHRECCTGASLDDVCAVLSPSDIGGARAALTAAAQVRERAALAADNAREDQLTLRTGDELTDLMPIYGATEDPPADIIVQCKCGWRGKQSELIWVSTTSTSHFCPQCSAEFRAFPTTEDQGSDVLGEPK